MNTESPKRKLQKQNDYQRHKLFRKIKRRRKAQAEAQQEVAEKQLKKKLKMPKYDEGKTREVYTKDLSFDNTGGGVDRYGNKFDYVALPDVEVKAQKLPTFDDIEKQIGRKITQGEIDKVLAMDPRIKLQLPNTPTEKGMYSPSFTNYLTNLVYGEAGEIANKLADATGTARVAPDGELIETRDGDALFDLLPFVDKMSAAGRSGRLVTQLLKNRKLTSKASQIASDNEVLRALDYNPLRLDYNPLRIEGRQRAALRMPSTDAGLTEAAEAVEAPINLSKIARGNSQIVDEAGNINMRNLVRARRQFRETYPEAGDFKQIFNRDFRGNSTNLDQHTKGVVRTAQDIPVPTGYTRQDLVQSALYHDIGKAIDTSQGAHEKISADMIQKAMNSDGFFGTQDVSNDVVNAIRLHGEGKRAAELDPLTQALHVADVARGMNYDQAAINIPQLFIYPREYKEFHFPQMSVHDELVTRINPVLKRQGYETIDPNSTREEAEAALDNIINEHRSFVRGVKDSTSEEEADKMLTSLSPTKINHGGRRGFESPLRHRYGTPSNDYDALYLSTNKDILSQYGGNKDYERAVVRIPQNEVSKTAPSLSERLLAGDFDMYDSAAVRKNRAPEGTFTMFEEPYRLQTGRSLQTDMINEDPNVPDVEWENGTKSSKVNANEPVSPIFSDITYGQTVNRINKILRESGVTKTQIKGAFNLDEAGEPIVESYSYLNQQGIKDLENSASLFEKLQIARNTTYVERIKQEEKELRKLIKSQASNTLEGQFQIQDLQDLLYDLKRPYLKALENVYNNGLISKDQYKAAKHTYDIDKYVKTPAIHKMLGRYFDGIKEAKKNKPNFKNRSKYLNNPENMAKFMRQKGVLPRYEHKTFNHVRTITPNEHDEDAVKNLATKNKQLGPMQLAVIGKRGERVVEKVKTISGQELKDVHTEHSVENLKKPTKRYRDKGNRITSIKLSRKTLK